MRDERETDGLTARGIGHLGVLAAPDVADQSRVDVGQLALVPQRVVSVHLQQREG